ncbi:hypothetical protein FB451DRAFT_1409504 [Mycena latifolia]|nr:hypothetical protein FB451DRAFT_1409504 [Mycena latifolia]
MVYACGQGHSAFISSRDEEGQALRSFAHKSRQLEINACVSACRPSVNQNFLIQIPDRRVQIAAVHVARAASERWGVSVSAARSATFLQKSPKSMHWQKSAQIARAPASPPDRSYTSFGNSRQSTLNKRQGYREGRDHVQSPAPKSPCPRRRPRGRVPARRDAQRAQNSLLTSSARGVHGTALEPTVSRARGRPPRGRHAHAAPGRASTMGASAAEVNTYHEPLHVVIHNAAASVGPFKLTADNLESQVAMDHIGPSLLTKLLAAKILAATTVDYTPRVVFVSSNGHSSGTGVNFNTVGRPDPALYEPMEAYYGA